MAKVIKYDLCSRVNRGTEEEPLWEDVLSPAEIRCTADNLSANEAIARKESYNGEYTIEDDGQLEPITEPTSEELFNVLLGVTE